MAQMDASLALNSPLAIDDPDNFGSSVAITGRNMFQRVSSRLHHKPVINYSEKALEHAALGSAQDNMEYANSEEDEEEVEWSQLEKERFLDGIDRFNSDFRQIAKFLKTKSIGQVKHYFNVNKKYLNLPPKSVPIPVVAAKVRTAPNASPPKARKDKKDGDDRKEKKSKKERPITTSGGGLSPSSPGDSPVPVFKQTPLKKSRDEGGAPKTPQSDKKDKKKPQIYPNSAVVPPEKLPAPLSVLFLRPSRSTKS